jgi:hypothetical protein
MGAQGFVSNRDSARGDERGDPVEAVMYAVFVATSERASVAELADMLQVRPECQGGGAGCCRKRARPLPCSGCGCRGLQPPARAPALARLTLRARLAPHAPKHGLVGASASPTTRTRCSL